MSLCSSVRGADRGAPNRDGAYNVAGVTKRRRFAICDLRRRREFLQKKRRRKIREPMCNHITFLETCHGY